MNDHTNTSLLLFVVLMLDIYWSVIGTTFILILLIISVYCAAMEQRYGKNSCKLCTFYDLHKERCLVRTEGECVEQCETFRRR